MVNRYSGYKLLARQPKPRRQSLIEIEQFKVLASEWHQNNYFGPECFGPFSQEKVNWLCRKKHFFRSTIQCRSLCILQGSKSRGCPVCSGKYRPPKKGERLPKELASEWLFKLNGIRASFLSTKSSRLGLWQCSICNHQWRTKVSSRLRQGCPACFTCEYPDCVVDITKDEKLSPFFDRGWRNSGYNLRNLPSTFAVFWLCPADPKHLWFASIGNVRYAKFQCPRCLHYLSEYPELLKDYDFESNDKIPANKLSIERNLGKLITWACDRGTDHIWRARLANRLRGDGCPFCSGRKLSKSNSLANCYPKLLKEFHPTKNHGLEANNISSCSTKKIWWQCQNCNHSWQTQVRLRTQRGYGCPKCKRRKHQSTLHS